MLALACSVWGHAWGHGGGVQQETLESMVDAHLEALDGLIAVTMFVLSALANGKRENISGSSIRRP